jgi:hypothetical protein
MRLEVSKSLKCHILMKSMLIEDLRLQLNKEYACIAILVFLDDVTSFLLHFVLTILRFFIHLLVSERYLALLSPCIYYHLSHIRCYL